MSDTVVEVDRQKLELLAAIRGWQQRFTHAELAVLCQAFYALSTHGDSPEWIRASAQAVIDELGR